MSNTDPDDGDFQRLLEMAAEKIAVEHYVKAAFEAAYLHLGDLDKAEQWVLSLVSPTRVQFEADAQQMVDEAMALGNDPSTPPLSEAFKERVLQIIKDRDEQRRG